MAENDGFKQVTRKNAGRKKKQKELESEGTESVHELNSNTDVVPDNNSLVDEPHPGPSNTDNNQTEDMGRGSQSEDTSDVDSVEFERQQRELEELDLQIQQEKAKRSAKEKRERKNKMVEMKHAAEQRRKELQEIRARDSDSDGVSPPKKPRKDSPVRRTSKSKDGKGVKNIKKGKQPHNSKKQKEKPKNGKDKENTRKIRKIKKTQHNRKSNNDTDSESSPENSPESSSTDEFQAVISGAKYNNKRCKKLVKSRSRSKSYSTEKRLDRGDSGEDSEDSSADSSSESSRSDASSSSGLDNRQSKKGRRKSKKRGKSIKSGVKAKAHRIRLKTSELCAQAVLDEEHYPGSYLLEELTFDQLVAGELEICTLPDIAKTEKQARLKILKLLAYFAQTLSQSSILEVYKAIILKVEKGLFVWSPELVQKAEHMLDRAVSKNNWKKEKEKVHEASEIRSEKVEKRAKKEIGIQLKNGEKVVYCLDFNKNKCDRDGSHEGKFGGKECIKHHICRACLNADKEKRFHAEVDEVCPQKSR